MEDHHVDRPGVEVQQCMKLTGTNRSIGLTHQNMTSRPHSGKRPKTGHAVTHRRTRASNSARQHPHIPGSCLGLVATARGKTPDPIPNSAVKTLRADGTAS